MIWRLPTAPAKLIAKKMSSSRMDDDISKPMMQEGLDMVVEGWVDHSGKDVDAGTHQQEPQNSEKSEFKRTDSAAIPLDLARLKELSRGDVEFQNELLEIFMEDALEHLAEVKQAFQTKDYVTLARRAHQLKGASATVAVQQLPDLAAQLEHQAIEHQLTNASELIVQLEVILEQIQTFISNPDSAP